MSEEFHNCVFCRFAAKKKNEADDMTTIECEKCGKYKISGSLNATLHNKPISFPHTTSSWIFEQNKIYGVTPQLLSTMLDDLLSIPDKMMSSKLEALILKINELELSNSSFLIGLEHLHPWLAETWSRDDKELRSIIERAIELSLIDAELDPHSNGWSLHFKKITYTGHEFIQTLGQNTEESNIVFMAFHFTEEMKETFEKSVDKAITDISKGKLKAERVRTSGTPTDTKIDDQLISMIKASKVVIADFTGQRQAVYYEAGYAMALGIPVIWTCREDEVDQLSFDTRQYPHILWKNPEDLYNQLTQRLAAQVL